MQVKVIKDGQEIDINTLSSETIQQIGKDNPLLALILSMNVLDKEQVVEECDFSDALDLLKEGCKLQRKGWNGKGMWLFKTIGNTVPYEQIPAFRSLPESVKSKLTELQIDVVFHPSITMFTATQEMQPGWLASQSDILANDWGIV